MADNLDELTNRFKSSAEDFSLMPSPATWEKVERELAGRERKRRFIIFFLLGGVLLLGGAVLFMNYSTGKNEAAVSQNNDPTVLTQPSILKDEKPKSPANNNATEQSSSRQDNAATISDPQQHLETVTDIKKESARSVIPEKSSDKSISGKSPAVNEEKNVVFSNEVESAKIISSTPDISNITSDIKATDSLHTKPAHDSLTAVHVVTLAKDSLPEEKDSIAEIPFVRKWSFTYGAALATNFTKFSEQGDYQFVAHYRDSSDKDLLTQNAHFNISYHIFPRVEIFTGIGFINYQERMLNNQVVYRDDTLPASGPFPPTIVVSKGYDHINGDSLKGVTNKFFYLQIPLGIRYTVFSLRKWNIGVQPEISFNKAIYTKGYRYDYVTREYKPATLSDLRALNINYGLGISFRYELRNNLQLELMPYFHSMQRSIFISSPFSQKFQQAEARVSLRYTFPK
jgi:hypothetical protein